MTESRDGAIKSVCSAIEAFNAAEGVSVPCSKETVLLGAGSSIDSLGLVRLIMMVERQVEEDFGMPISLTDDKAMSQRSSPFRSVGALAEYVDSFVRHGGGG